MEVGTDQEASQLTDKADSNILLKAKPGQNGGDAEGGDGYSGGGGDGFNDIGGGGGGSDGTDGEDASYSGGQGSGLDISTIPLRNIILR